MNLDEAIEFVKRNIEEGVDCPCCGQFAKSYKRKLNSTMAGTLCWLDREHSRTGSVWINVPRDAPRFIISTNQTGTIAHWKLVESTANENPEKRCSGLWRLTDLGRRFVRGEALVPAYVWLYDNVPLRWAEETTDIHQALGRRFNYSELMS